MKTINKFLFCLIALACLTEVHANILTVSNREGDNAQYSTINAAMSAAAVGDTLYISGSPTSYGSISVSKKLTFIGPGYNPVKDLTSIVNLNNITIYSAGSGSAFIGLKITTLNTYSNQIVSNIYITRCQIDNVYYGGYSSASFSKNWVIENNVINLIRHSYTAGTYQNNFVISNNIIQGEIRTVGYSLVANNVFTGTSTANVFYNVTESTLANNIFYNRNPGGLTRSILNNNISFGGSSPNIPYGDNTGTANIVGVNPDFVSVTSNTFSYSHDYRLMETSVGKNAGTDGTDIGVFGGSGFTVGGEPAIPVITAFNILNPIIGLDGTLQIEIQGESKN